MKTSYVALALLASLGFSAPAMADPDCGPATVSSGFIQVGNQVRCIRALTADEVRANQQWAAARRAEIQRQNDAEQVRELGRQMDRAGNTILQGNGQERYRDALRDYIEASAEHRIRYGTSAEGTR